MTSARLALSALGQPSVNRLSERELLAQWTARLSAGDRNFTVLTLNTDILQRCTEDPRLTSLLSADYVLADGAPIAWMATRLHGVPVPRVTGSGLVASLLEPIVLPGCRILLVGGVGDVGERARRALAARRGPDAVRLLQPPVKAMFSERDYEAWADIARAFQADVVLVALGFPKQEVVAAELRARYGALYLGVGASLEMLVGARPRASQIVQALGLEWAVRLRQDPKRLFRRYVRRNLPFLVRLLLALARRSGA